MNERHLATTATSRLILIAALVAFVVIVYWPSYASIVALWDTSDHRYGMLVLPISAFLLWRIRHELEAPPIFIERWGLLPLLLLTFAWLIARFAGVQIVEHFTVLAMIPAAVFTFFGRELLYRGLFPLTFLLLATPVSDTFIPYLMQVTADISTALLRASGFPVLRQGQHISLPGGNFVVADVCSGARYLVTGVMLALLYGYLNFASNLRRVVLVVVTAVVLVVANGVRAYIVMAVASITNMQYFGGRDHIYFGWLLFGIVIMLMMWLGARYSDLEPSHAAGPGTAPASEARHSRLPLIMGLGLVMLAVTVKPLQADFGPVVALLVVVLALFLFLYLMARRGRAGKSTPAGVDTRYDKRGWRDGLVVLLGLVIILSMPIYAKDIEAGAVETTPSSGLAEVVPCGRAGAWEAPWLPTFESADVSESGAFQCSRGLVNMFTAAYAGTSQGRELVSSVNEPFPDQLESVSESGKFSVIGAGDEQFEVREIRVEKAGYRALVWYWYDVDGRKAATGAMTKALQIIALARGRPAGGRIIVLETPATDDWNVAQERLAVVFRSLASADLGRFDGGAM